VVCYACKSNENEFWAEENGFTVVRCGCGLLYVNPRPRDEDISAAVRTGLHEGAETQNAIGSYWPRTKPGLKRRILDMFQDPQLPAGGFSWLDVGCGFGEFLEVVTELSHGLALVRGCEPSLPKLTSAQERGLDVSFFDLRTHGERYDYISMLNVYSHLPEPVSALVDLRRLLKPNGQLLLQTGDVTALSRDDFPYKLNLPGHLSFAPESVLRKVLADAGFNVIGVKKYFYNTIERSLTQMIAEDLWQFVRHGGSLRRLQKLPQARRDMWVRACLR
jgi:SAM-dependent methyltransferase